MKRSYEIPHRGLMVIYVFVLGIFVTLSAQAQNAASALSGYNSAYLVQNGQTFYASTMGSTTPEGEWQQALDIYPALDAYRYSRTQTNLNLVNALLNSLTYYNSAGSLYGNWQTDGWDDNLAWMVNAYLQGYLLTGNSSYLSEAEAGWNNGYNQGWNTSVAGGGIWENTGDGSKCALSNDPFVWEGVQLYQATGTSSYLTKAEAIYAWVRSNLVNTTSTTSSTYGAPGQVNGCVGSNGQLQGQSDNVYDAGGFVEAASILYQATGNTEYSSDAQRTISHIQGEGSVIPYDNSGENGHAWEYWFTRGLSDYSTYTGSWSTYQTYLQDNANAAWNERNTTYNITWNDWSDPTSTSSSDPNEMSSGAAVQQHLPPPALNLSGTWEIQNANSGMALNVTGGSKTNGAAIIQYPFSSGATNAEWTFVPSGGGYYTIKNVNSGQVVNVSAASSTAGALIVQWPAQSMIPGNDQWYPVQNSNGTYSFYNLNSYQALEVPGYSTTEGTQLDQWFGNFGSNQEFNLIPE
jgi:Ricin-type beta-trefoil lectin domain-like/Glycosyl hydrolase family 76